MKQYDYNAIWGIIILIALWVIFYTAFNGLSYRHEWLPMTLGDYINYTILILPFVFLILFIDSLFKDKK